MHLADKKTFSVGRDGHADRILPEPLPVLPTRPPEAPDLPPRKNDPSIIETVQDADGTYIPANPILRKKKKKDARLTLPGQLWEGAGR